ncbi:MAG TPA: LPS export ABC transporter periplasmic protein LptC [Woeseiaceae bacterium]|nr:LPS export ABC transporter periplasmic protein LptC [Woeseiaceae bacterium]
MSSRAPTIIIILSLAAIGSWYLARSNVSSDVDAFPTDPMYHGYYLKNARILGTGKDGSLLYEIEAERAEQQEDKRIEFSNVQIRYSPASDVPWIVNADNASLSSDNPMITLRGHVKITNSDASGDGDGDTEIRTQYLELNPERYIAETDRRVQIRFGSRSVTATGMLASLEDDRIQLKANVRGKIAP